MNLLETAKILEAYRAREVSKIVDPDDLMFKNGKPWYFSVGESGLNACLHAVGQSWIGKIKRIMDLPCGHGRVARHLRAAFPDAEMFFCEIDRRGADFCAREFGGTAVYSKPEMTDADLPGNLDLIWVGSLFTHVDEARTRRWLTHLSTLLSPHGILVATFHGLLSVGELERTSLPMVGEAAWRKALQQYNSTGFGYTPYANYELGDYGLSLSSPSKILEIATSIPGVRVGSFSERGWANNHDVLALVKNDRVTPLT